MKALKLPWVVDFAEVGTSNNEIAASALVKLGQIRKKKTAIEDQNPLADSHCDIYTYIWM